MYSSIVLFLVFFKANSLVRCYDNSIKEQNSKNKYYATLNYLRYMYSPILKVGANLT